MFDRKILKSHMREPFKSLSVEYMLDCIFNEDIQKNWKPAVGDIIVGLTGNIFVISGHHTLDGRLGGDLFLFGGGLCSKDGSCIMNDTYCFTMNESGKWYTWKEGEAVEEDDPYHDAISNFRFVPYPHEI